MATAYLSVGDALAFAKKCLTDGIIRLSGHATLRLAERDFDLLDVRRAIRFGKIFKPPELDIKHGDWKYRLEGCSVDNRELVLIVYFKSEFKTLVITVFRMITEGLLSARVTRAE